MESLRHKGWLLAATLGVVSVVVFFLALFPSNNRWGNRLDPIEFWKGRTIWCDREAQNAARKHGREYPPIPGDTNYYLAGSGGDIGYISGGPDSGPFVTHYQNDRERYFWDDFFKTHPIPPEYLEMKQMEVACDVYHARQRNQEAESKIAKYAETDQRAKNQRERNLAELARSEKHARRDLATFNYPEEAFTDDALYWCRVMALRSHKMQMFLEREYADIDPKMVTEPLTAGQIKAANAWKVAYLQRLRREKTDESYLNAYLKTWNLNPADVFPQKENH